MPSSPKKLKRVVIKEELVALTGDWLKALVLNQFLYWGQRVSDFDAFILEERLRNNQPDLELTHGWIWKSVRDLKDELMVEPLSDDTVRRRITSLVKSNWLEERNNPKHKWDRTLQYRPNIRKVQRDLQAIGYALDDYPLFIENSAIPHDAESEPRGEESTPGDAASSPHGAAALPEITTEVTIESLPPPIDAASVDTHSLTDLPPADVQAGLIFSGGIEPNGFDPDKVREMQQRVQLHWGKLRGKDVVATCVYLLLATGWEIPSPAQRRRWGKELREHARERNFSQEELPGLYAAAWKILLEGKGADGKSLTLPPYPSTLTATMESIKEKRKATAAPKVTYELTNK